MRATLLPMDKLKLGLTDSVSKLAGVGLTRKKQLESLGIETIKDLLYYVPFRYETVEKSVKIAGLTPETTANFQAKVISKIPIRTRRFSSMIKARVSDETGNLDLTWFNTPFILSTLAVGQTYYFTGKVSEYKGKLTLTNPTVEKSAPEFGSLIPVYHESVDITSRQLRRWIKEALTNTDLSDDPSMKDVYQRHQLMDLRSALNEFHMPTDINRELLSAGRKRLAFDEMFALILGVMKRKNAASTIPAGSQTHHDQ